MLQQKKPWQLALIQAVTNPKELLELLELTEDFLPGAIEASKLFPLKVPRGFIARMQKHNRYDPLLLQVLPIDTEKKEVSGYTTDPLLEKKFNPVPGLLHKYRGRVLLILTSACGINCRFCFRRHFPYAENNPKYQNWEPVLHYIANDKTIHEVILSGGDPLVMNDHILGDLSQKLAQIPHLKRLRLHTRMPVVLPERINEELIEWIRQSTLKTTIVIHANHPKEIDEHVKTSLAILKDNGVTLLNQTVLLKGINDSAEILTELSEVLFAAGVLPYYLHLLDKVQGTAHFDMDLKIAKKIYEQLQAQLSGYLVPKLVVENPGAHSKSDATLLELYTD